MTLAHSASDGHQIRIWKSQRDATDKP